MAPFVIPSYILTKIREKHGVELEEVKEAFFNRIDHMPRESREKHQRDYKKIWFISETDSGRLLKVVIAESDEDQLTLMSAYDPCEEDIIEYENEIKNIKADTQG